jgi:deazaflavin-dependent oxidoreductase (nitroreductase family)
VYLPVSFAWRKNLPEHAKSSLTERKAATVARIKKISRFRRLANWVVVRLLRLGVPLWRTYLLTVEGRKTGRLHTTPVTLLTRDGQRHLVAPYGEVDWVHNARAAGKVTLSRGRRYEVLPVTELDPAEAAPILRQYARDIPVMRFYLDASVKDPLERWEIEAKTHPVFRLGDTS